MTSDNVFGSHELTPDLLRGTSFPEEDGRVDAAEVAAFLDRVASSLEVFMSGDAPTAMRAEFDRNAAIATQILDAGQNASEQLRRQAAEEAKRILDEARDATLGLRETVEVEIEQARTQVEAMRGTFIQDLRDLYDRIGASLYRFERAAEESAVAPIQEPSRAEPAVEHGLEEVGSNTVTLAEPEPEPEPEPPVPEPAAEPELPEGAKPPAWQQLPPEAWAASSPATAPGDEPLVDVPATEPPSEVSLAAETPAAEVPAIETPAVDPFAPVVEDEPLAPGEPLVDLRTFGSAVDEAETVPPPPPEPEPEPEAVTHTVTVTDTGASWLDPLDDMPPVAPQAAGEPAAAASPTEAPPAADGGWLDTPLDPGSALPAETADPDVAHDDALAEALIAGDGPEPLAELADVTSEPVAPVPAPVPVPAPAPADVPVGAPSPDAASVRQLILDSLAAGQTRETVEAYLREHMGLLEPGALIDAALGSVDQP